MITKTQAELLAALPATVTLIGMDEACRINSPFESKGSAFPTPEAAELAARINRLPKRRRPLHRFMCLPADAKNVNCEHAGHVLMSRLLPTGDVEFFDGEASRGGAKGQMPATFAYLTLPWPPTPETKPTDTQVHFVCGFCAATLSEGWAEAEAEARMS